MLSYRPVVNRVWISVDWTLYKELAPASQEHRFGLVIPMIQIRQGICDPIMNILKCEIFYEHEVDVNE